MARTKKPLPYPDRYTASCIDVRACPFRSCMWPGEDKGSFTVGVGYTHYYDVPRPTCMTRHREGCPTPLPEPDPEVARCCYRPAYKPRGGAKAVSCATCGGQVPRWAVTALNGLPTLAGVPCAHPPVQRAGMFLRGWTECLSCGGVWDTPAFAAHAVPAYSLDEYLERLRVVLAAHG